MESVFRSAVDFCVNCILVGVIALSLVTVAILVWVALA
jgi:hypothetical protein